MTSEYALVFHYTAVDPGGKTAPRCQVEFSDVSSADLGGYRPLGAGHGTLGLVTLNEDVFVCVVTGSSQAATVRPGEGVSRIDSVDFCMYARTCARTHTLGTSLSNGNRLSEQRRLRIWHGL